MHIQGKVVLITGASEGIGAACAQVLRGRGARLVLVARTLAKLERVAAPGDLVLPADITSSESRKAVMSAALERFGGIDILVNNAGVGLYAPAWKAPIDEVRRMFEINLFAVLELAQLGVPQMDARGGGMIVNVSSIAGKMTLPWFTMYSASKHALNSMTEGLGMELRSRNIRAMTVCPGYVRTSFQDHVLAGNPPDSIRRARRFAITAGECAEAIARGIERNARTVVTPAAGWLLIAVQRLLPALTQRYLARMNERLEAE